MNTESVEQLIPLTALTNDVHALRFACTAGEVLVEKLELRRAEAKGDRAPGRRNAQNIVLVVIDTLRADKLSMYNPQTRVQTPFLDAVVRKAMTFSQPLAAENWTKPSTASILSGLYPETHQTKTERNSVPASVTLMSAHFKQLGWTTAGFVANGYVSDKFGFKRGWDTWTNYVREGKVNRAQAVADDVNAWLSKRPAGKPFFLYVHTIDPHVPYIPPNKYRALYDDEPYNGKVEARDTARLLERIKGGLKLSDRDKFRLEALYDGEISYHDDHLARIYAELERQNLLEDTAIIITSDHGEEFFEHGSVGHGHSVYQEMLQVPLIVVLPGATPQDSPARSNVDVSLTDIMPTVCDLTGTECPADLDGTSLLPLLDGALSRRFPDAAFSEFLDGQRVIRMGRWKLIVRGFRTTVFDLEKDPGETKDLSDLRPVSFEALKDRLGMHLGRFHRHDNATTSGRSSAPPARHRATDVVIDPETRKQLEALGYMGH
jgi:arylsulfatase A-like enzyme